MKAALSAALVLLLAACSDSTGTAGGVRVTTNHSVYSLSHGTYPEVGVKFIVKNTGSTTIALPDCGGSPVAELQQQQGAEWVTVVSGQICLPIYVSGPKHLAPGDLADGYLQVRAAGAYRVRIEVLDSADGEPAHYIVSRTFVVG
jgi:hypothetical protein